MSEEQLAFDIEGMLHEAAVEAAPGWTGAPLRFTTAYFPPADLDAAFAHWQLLHAQDKSHVNSRMWRRLITVPESDRVTGHGLVRYTADLRCEPWKHAEKHGGCTCLGNLMYQTICEPCEWNGITDSENDAVEMWHDHAIPGWRELPIVPSRLRMMDKDSLSKAAKKWLSKAAKKWIVERYPKSMQITGAPIITERRPYGTRHVPGRSPWGGYDLSHTAVDPDRVVEGAKPLRRAHDFALEPTRAAAQPGIGLGD